MNLPNKLTVIRCVMTFLFLVVLLMNFPFHYGLALLIFIAASLTDYFDGKIARRDGLITNLGKFLDPLADKMLTTAAFLGIMCEMGSMDILCWALMLILAREFMVTSVRLLAAKDGVVVAASFAGKLKTVMQMVSVIYMLTAMQLASFDFMPRELSMILLIVGIVLIWVSVVATVVSGVQYVWALRHYFKES
ncbi:MAG: CDP-diacylglycerol--glycerol-3-phosphate 3-phosphatidyltransferase [Clostridia bacterium]|nr:CDP-diacylglycerol--glycerol-3-phosphate 3-phosphatidyltransferase [Clostridia bacterium]